MFDRIRGRLSPHPLGAREIEKLARNPRCLRLALLTAARLPASYVLEAVFDQPNRRVPPPTAVLVGRRFEAALFRDRAAALREAYRTLGLLTIPADRVLDIARLHPGTSPDVLAQRARTTERAITQRLRGDKSAPLLIIMPRLRLSVAGQHVGIEPDYLVACDERVYRPAEIKSYVFREARTDPAEVTGARRQAAVSVLALRALYAHLGVSSTALNALVPAEADLVFREPARMKPRIQRERIDGEVFALGHTLDRLEDRIREAATQLASGRLDAPAAVCRVPARLTDACHAFCDLAPVCGREAVLRGDVAQLGDDVREQFGDGVRLDRVRALVSGRAAPSSHAEAHLATRLRRALHGYHRAMAD